SATFRHDRQMSRLRQRLRRAKGMNMRLVIALIAALILASPTPASPSAKSPTADRQAPAQAGTLVVTVVDSTGAVLPGATVTVAGIEPANKPIAIEPVKATEQGMATIQKL